MKLAHIVSFADWLGTHQGIIAVSQYLTERIFREHLAKFGVQVELGTESVSIKQDGTGVNLSLKHAGSDEVETVRCAYVIGADGARGQFEASICATRYSLVHTGWTRKAIGATFEGQTKDTDGQVWADVMVEGISSEVGVYSFSDELYRSDALLRISVGMSGLRPESSRECGNLMGAMNVLTSVVSTVFSCGRRRSQANLPSASLARTSTQLT